MEIIRITLGGKEYYCKTKFTEDVEMWIWQTAWGYSEDVIKDGFFMTVSNYDYWLYYFHLMQDDATGWNDSNAIYKILEDE